MAAAVSLAIMAATTAAAAAGCIPYGDANGDGQVTSADYIAVKNHISGTRAITGGMRLALADADKDGEITIGDCERIKEIILEAHDGE